VKSLIVIAMLSSLLVAVTSFADDIKVEGGGTAIMTIFLPIKDRFEKLHGDTLSIVQSTAVKGLIALQEGRVDLATGAHPLEDLVAGAAEKGIQIDTRNLVVTPIEENRLVVIVNRSNPVTLLSKAQLKGVFTGAIKNWQEVGGRDVPVDVVWGEETHGQNVQFDRIALDKNPLAKELHRATTYQDISLIVSQSPGGIGVVPLIMTTPVTRSVETVLITSPIYIITKGAPSAKVQQVIDFYQREYSFLR
jgi:phosphate transport system substrate-binding protein